jgi:hypothetical protein
MAANASLEWQRRPWLLQPDGDGERRVVGEGGVEVDVAAALEGVVPVARAGRRRARVAVEVLRAGSCQIITSPHRRGVEKRRIYIPISYGFYFSEALTGVAIGDRPTCA